MPALQPDAVFMPDEPTDGLRAFTNLDAQVTQIIRARVAAIHRQKTIPLFIIGVAGGVFGARLAGVKVHPAGLVTAGAAAALAYRSLSSAPPIKPEGA